MSSLTADSFPQPLNSQSLVSEKEAGLTFVQKVFFGVFLMAMIVCWSPLKMVAYVSPWIGLGMMILLVGTPQIILRMALVLLAWVLPLMVYSWLTPGYVLHSSIIALLTYGTFVFMLVVPGKAFATELLSSKMLIVTRWTLLFQSSWGLIQGILAGIRNGTFDGDTGDAVAGTIRPFTHAEDFSNPMYALNVAMMLLMIFPSLVREGKGVLAFTMGCLSLVLASVMHLNAVMVVAVGLGFAIHFPTILFNPRGLMALVVVAFCGFLFANLLSENVSTTESMAENTLQLKTPRAKLVHSVFTRMPNEYPLMPIIGIGTGQFSSRAGLMGTGLYFGGPTAHPKPLPFMGIGMSNPFRDYVYDLWMKMSYNPTINDSSSAYKPYLSWLTVYVEWGLAGVALILLFVARIIWNLLWYERLFERRIEAASLTSLVIFVFLMGVFENYWEVPQCIFIGLLLFKIRYPLFIDQYRVSPQPAVEV